MENQPQQNTEIPAPPVAEQSSVPTPPVMQENTGDKHYGGFWLRFLAILIDSIILSVVGSLFGATQINGGFVSVSFYDWKVIIPIAYYIGFWIWKSATPGKMALGLKIVDEQGKNISVSQAFIRYFSMILSAIPFMLGFIWVGFEPKKRGWHDMIAKTYVIKTK